MNLEHLKVGDKIMSIDRMWNTYQVKTIHKVTKTQLICEGVKVRRSDGYQLGEKTSRYSFKTDWEVYDKDEIKNIEDKETLKQLERLRKLLKFNSVYKKELLLQVLKDFD